MGRTRVLRLWQGARPGQTLVEFAFALPIIALLIIGVVDLGRGFFWYGQLTNGVREGARVATFDQNATTIRSEVINRANLGLTDSDITITCYSGFSATTKSCTGLALGDGVKVAATKSYVPITAGLIAIIGGNITISAEAMRSVQ